MAISTVIVGIGLAGAGAATTINAAKKAEAAQKGIIAQQQKAEEQRMLQMRLEAKARKLTALRGIQQARSVALTNASSQGALFSSGLAGGYGQIQGQGQGNLLGINQGQMIGENMFAINKQLSQYNMQLAAAQSQAQIGGALSSFGGTLISNVGTIGRLSSGFGGGGYNYNAPGAMGYSTPGSLKGLY